LTPVIDLYDGTAHNEEGSSLWWYKRIDGSGADVNLGQVSFVKITNGGSGYTQVPAVEFTGGGGNGASAIAIISGGKVSAVRLTNSGSGYTSAPVVQLTGGNGTGASARAYYSDGWHLGFGRMKSDFEFGQEESPVYDEGKRQFASKKEDFKASLVFTSLQDDAFTEQFLTRDANKYRWAIFQHAGISRDGFQKYRYIGIVKLPGYYKASAPGREPELKGIIMNNKSAISVSTADLPVIGLSGNYNISAGEGYSVQEEVIEPNL
jgi:hypothetical protein